jgi:hypothetical protein
MKIKQQKQLCALRSLWIHLTADNAPTELHIVLGCDRTGLDGASFCDQENFKNALVNHQTSESALRARYKVVLFFGLPLENDFPGAVIAESTALRKVQPGKTALLSKTFDRGRRR